MGPIATMVPLLVLLSLLVTQGSTFLFPLFALGQGNSFCNGKPCTHIYNFRPCSYWNPAQCTSSGCCPAGYTKESAGTKCYIVRTGQTSWSNANSICTSNGDKGLAVITSATQNTAVAGLAASTGTWAGLSDTVTEGTFLWNDGSTPAYTNWATGQPSAADAKPAANQDCVKIKTDGTWDDVGCNKKSPFNFIIERAPTC